MVVVERVGARGKKAALAGARQQGFRRDKRIDKEKIR